MKTSSIFPGALMAAFSLALSACGDKEASAGDAGKAPETASDAYPLDVCVVAGEKLGSMGKPYIIDYKGTEVRFCCKDCEEEFNKDPGKYLAMLKSGKVE